MSNTMSNTDLLASRRVRASQVIYLSIGIFFGKIYHMPSLKLTIYDLPLFPL